MTVQRASGEWFKSSYSPDKADCVEVRLEVEPGSVVGVRDSKAPEQGQLAVSGLSWQALLRAIAR
ncbi:DUF397 domain-containing protein [Amycolatopsis sp. Hca4]|uniref:DUF397 domain-containing protein n=1 Tax=Amycolatopsis sp. Hca4 TaxID=2742131 RepID=UPI001591554E|nr:DUF397 domain-containing protein [Amycolatopsis sp. Hca4]QKV80698.1 DUF397 domain-containing protein [Amycolatopsis sp. Hca4]